MVCGAIENITNITTKQHTIHIHKKLDKLVTQSSPIKREKLEFLKKLSTEAIADICTYVISEVIKQPHKDCPKGIFEAWPSKSYPKQKVNNKMPILDPVKKTIAQKHRLYMKICRDCGSRNAETALKCRKCKGKNLRWKKREIVK